MNRWGRSSVLTLALVLGTTLAWGQPVAVVATGDQATQVIQYLAQQLDRPVVQKSSENARRLETLVVQARREWEEDLVVVIDMDGATVSVLRPSDGTVTSRALDPAAAKAPYAVALAAVELIDLVSVAPAARAASLPPARSPVPPQPGRAPTTLDSPSVEPTPPPAPQSQLFVGPAISVGAMQTLSSTGDVGLLQPTLGIDAQFRRPSSATWVGVGVHLAGLTGRTLQNVVPPPTDSFQPGNIRYRRDEIAIRPHVGHGSEAGSAVGWLNIGASRVEVTATDHAGNQVLSDVRGALWLGFGGELRYTIGAGVAAAIGAGMAWYPQRSQVVLASPDVVGPVIFEEGLVEFRGRLTLVWEARP